MSKRKTNEQFVAELGTINANIMSLEPYTNCHSKIKMHCLLCGNQWYATPSKLLVGKGCPYCSGRRVNEKSTRAVVNNLALLKEWDFNKNKESPSNISVGSEYYAWWIWTDII